MLDAFFLRGQQQGVFRIDIPAPALTEIWVSILLGLVEAERHVRIARAGLATVVERAFIRCRSVGSYAALLGDDYLIEHGKYYYSVPWRHRGDVVDQRITATSMEIFRRNKRLTIHALLSEPGEISRYDEHMPVAHRRVQDGEPHALLN